MYIPSVRGVALALLVISTLSFRFSNVLLEGKWICASKSGNLNTDASYELKCAGTVHFQPNHLLVSDCYDGFFPTGARWEVVGNQLMLRDSDERVFAEFHIQRLDQAELLLQRRNVLYRFTRAAD